MKLTLILLAAGNSRRFDGNNLLTPFHGKPMYQYIVEEVEKLPDGLFDDKIVVTDIAVTAYKINIYDTVYEYSEHLDDKA